MKFYKRVENNITTTVESYSHNLVIEGAIEITQAEHDAFITSLPAPEPDPDILRAGELLASSANVITQPEMWELMRIFGRRLGLTV